MIDERFLLDSYAGLKKHFSTLVSDKDAEEMATLAMDLVSVNLSLALMRSVGLEMVNHKWEKLKQSLPGLENHLKNINPNE